MTTKLLIRATALAVSIEDARLAVRADGNELDVLIETAIREITDHAEHLMGRSIMRQTWQETSDSFSGVMRLYNPPLISVSSVKYIDTSGALQTMPATDYWVDSGELAAYIIPKNGWPNCAAQPNAVTVEYVCGYGNTPADVPPAIRGYLLAKLVEQFDASNQTVQTSVQASFIDSLLDRYRVWA